jgi:hypothetical protein
MNIDDGDDPKVGPEQLKMEMWFKMTCDSEISASQPRMD